MAINLKKRNLQTHALQRAWERYGYDLTKQDYDEMNEILKYKMYRTEHLLEHKGKTYRVIFDNPTKQIVTFLPIETIERD